MRFAVQHWKTKVWESHLEVSLHVIIVLVHVEAEEFLRECFETLLVKPVGPGLTTFTPLLDLSQCVIEFYCCLMDGQSWCRTCYTFVNLFVQVKLQVPRALAQSLVGIEQINDCTGNWSVNVFCFHAVDLDSKS